LGRFFAFRQLTRGIKSMTHAIRFHKPGGPEVLVWEEIKLGNPGRGEARIRHTAVGLNFVDIYNRSGLYPVALPSGLGSEAAGVVEEIGPDVTDLKPGDRVAYGSASAGAYAEERLIPADRLIKLPDSIDDKTAAAMMLKGLTVQYLIRQTYRVKAGETILLHAAAGGVGLILGQWAKHLGVTVIGTVGSDEKAKTRQGAWLRPHHRLHARGFRKARRRDHRRQQGAGGLRFRRQGYVPEIAGLPGAAGIRRAVRTVLWQCRAA
jgi:NADPH:quinone reductase-like Zn-dependent oxidoreductase